MHIDEKEFDLLLKIITAFQKWFPDVRFALPIFLSLTCDTSFSAIHFACLDHY